MTDGQIFEIIQRAVAARRGYADSRSWPIDRGVEERGIAQDFIEAAIGEPGAPFSNLRLRRRGEDPPDCEALDASGHRIAIEVTELVDRETVETLAKHRRAGAIGAAHSFSFEWNSATFLTRVHERLARKDQREKLKGGPYDEYILVIYTAEQGLDAAAVRLWVGKHRFAAPRGIDRAFLSLDYEPGAGYPLVRLLW
jgi:hypothetical protein